MLSFLTISNLSQCMDLTRQKKKKTLSNIATNETLYHKQAVLMYTYYILTYLCY